MTLVDEGGRPIDEGDRADAAHGGAHGDDAERRRVLGTGPTGASAGGVRRTGGADASEHNLPLFLWIDFRVEQLRATAALATLHDGARSARRRSELEVPHYAGDAAGARWTSPTTSPTTCSTAARSINDGDTIGLTDEVQVTAHRGPSMLGGELEVIRLEFERTHG